MCILSYNFVANLNTHWILFKVNGNHLAVVLLHLFSVLFFLLSIAFLLMQRKCKNEHTKKSLCLMSFTLETVHLLPFLSSLYTRTRRLLFLFFARFFVSGKYTLIIGIYCLLAIKAGMPGWMKAYCNDFRYRHHLWTNTRTFIFQTRFRCAHFVQFDCHWCWRRRRRLGYWNEKADENEGTTKWNDEENNATNNSMYVPLYGKIIAHLQNVWRKFDVLASYGTPVIYRPYLSR